MQKIFGASAYINLYYISYPTSRNIEDRQIIWEEIFDFGGNFKSLNFKNFEIIFFLCVQEEIF